MCDKYLIQLFIEILIFWVWQYPTNHVVLDHRCSVWNSRNWTRAFISNNDNLAISGKFAKVRPLFYMLKKCSYSLMFLRTIYQSTRWRFHTSTAIQRKCICVQNQLLSGVNIGRFARIMVIGSSSCHIPLHPIFKLRVWDWMNWS